MAKKEHIAADRNKVLSEQDDEAGMMKCMFHVEDRKTICSVLAARTKSDFIEGLMKALGLSDLGSTDIEASW